MGCVDKALFQAIKRRHFDGAARQAGCAMPVEPIIEDILARTSVIIEQVRPRLPTDFSAQVAETILDGLAQAAKTLTRHH